MNRPHHPALVCEGPGEWILRQWAHTRDHDRVASEPWPFAWSIPAPGLFGVGGTGDARVQGPPPGLRRYAAQAALYADNPDVQHAGRALRSGQRGVRPDRVLIDDIGPEDERIGTELHQAAEHLARGDVYYRRAGGRPGDQLEDVQHLAQWRHR